MKQELSSSWGRRTLLTHVWPFRVRGRWCPSIEAERCRLRQPMPQVGECQVRWARHTPAPRGDGCIFPLSEGMHHQSPGSRMLLKKIPGSRRPARAATCVSPHGAGTPRGRRSQRPPLRIRAGRPGTQARPPGTVPGAQPPPP